MNEIRIKDEIFLECEEMLNIQTKRNQKSEIRNEQKEFKEIRCAKNILERKQ